MSTSSGGGVTGAVPGGAPTPEGAFDADLVSRIANEFYADTPPHEPESAVPKSDPVRGRDVTEEMSSFSDVPNAPENLLGAQAAASPHGMADPAYYFLEHPEAPDMPSGTPTTPMPTTPADALHPESSVDPLSMQGGASHAAAAASPAAAGAQEDVPAEVESVPPPAGYVPTPAVDETPSDLPRATPDSPPTPASPDAARPEGDFDPDRLQALVAPMFANVPSLFGMPQAGHPATPDVGFPTHASPALGVPDTEIPGEGETGLMPEGTPPGLETMPAGMPSAGDMPADLLMPDDL
nr:hypothetical protein [Planctomycetota bacterium]